VVSPESESDSKTSILLHRDCELKCEKCGRIRRNLAIILRTKLALKAIRMCEVVKDPAVTVVKIQTDATRFPALGRKDVSDQNQ
jgi:hypothetical protein